MKLFVLLSGLLLGNIVFAQTKLPTFMQGTWNADRGNIHEHWDVISPTLMKGYSYEIVEGQIIVSEYLEIAAKGKTTYYSATVIGQNDGKPVQFKMTRADSVYIFENPKHDFPNKITYVLNFERKVSVDVRDNAGEGFGYVLTNEVDEEREIVEEVVNDTDNPNYDAELAEKTGSDDYGMKSYVFVILKTGTNTTTDKKYIDSCFAGHMSNMGVLVEKDQLVVAGPFQKNDKTYRGLFILNVATIEEAKKVLATDPAVNAGLLDYEVYGWYGSAALSEYLEASDKIWKKKF